MGVKFEGGSWGGFEGGAAPKRVRNETSAPKLTKNGGFEPKFALKWEILAQKWDGMGFNGI